MRLSLVGLVLILAACEAPSLPEPIPPLTYDHLPPIALNVAQIEVIEEYAPTLRSPNVEHLFPTSPARAIRQWAKDRLRAVGETGTARFIIQDARVVETKLEKAKGLRGAFTKEQSERYDGRLQVTLEIRSERGFRDAFATGQADHSNTAIEGISLEDRERLFHAMTAALVDAATVELEKNIEQFLRDYLP
jgi:hypothetical protein